MPSSCDNSCSAKSSSPGNITEEAKPSGEQLAQASWLTSLSVSKMDCPSEERMIRLALNGVSQIVALKFDLAAKTIQIFHQADTDEFINKLLPLNLGVKLLETRATEESDTVPQTDAATEQQETRSLYWLLAINAVMFLLELSLGVLGQSTGLIADSLDMFADAAVYALALYAVGRGIQHQVRAAYVSGWLQMILALGALMEVGRRFIYGSEPQSPLMMSVGLLALIANVGCLMLIYRHRDGGAHMKASLIFSANDVIANLGIIVAGALVAWTGSRYPDLVIGALIGLVVLYGARRILRLKA